jgi:hypothetical protein
MAVRKQAPKMASLWRDLMRQCADPNCPKKTLLQTFSHRLKGMTFEDHWYCDANCFERAVKRKIVDLMSPQGKSTSVRNSRVPIGLLLLSRGVLTSEQLRAGLDHQQSSGLNFGDAVQQLGFATSDQVTAAVASQWACPVFSVGDRQLSVQVRIPRRLLELYRLLPVHFSQSDRRLMIGFVTGVQHQLLYTIGHMTSCPVAACFITGREYELQLNSPLTTFLHEDELVFEQIVDPAEMARITLNYAVQFAADKVRMGKCREFLWVRIFGRGREMDLLFRVEGN